MIKQITITQRMITMKNAYNLFRAWGHSPMGSIIRALGVKPSW